MADWRNRKWEEKIMDAGITVMLDKQQTNQLKIMFWNDKRGYWSSRIDTGLERPFLKGKRWLNIWMYHIQLLKFKRMGLPVILLENGVVSKKNAKWILSHQI